MSMCGYYETQYNVAGRSNEVYFYAPVIDPSTKEYATRWRLYEADTTPNTKPAAEGYVPVEGGYDASRTNFLDSIPAAEQAVAAWYGARDEGVAPQDGEPVKADDFEYLERLAEDEPIGDIDGEGALDERDEPLTEQTDPFQDTLIDEAGRLIPHFEGVKSKTSDPNYVSPISGLSNLEAVRRVRDLLTAQLVSWGEPVEAPAPSTKRVTFVIVEGAKGDTPESAVLDAARTAKDRVRQELGLADGGRSFGKTSRGISSEPLYGRDDFGKALVEALKY
jgi:hypothetical protein